MELSEARGRLVAIGGAEDKEGDRRVLKEVVKLARGPKARIVVMTVATDHPEETGGEYVEVFKRLGVDDVRALDVSTRADALDEKALEAIKEATCLFFTGGDQLHVTSLIGGTEMQALIHRRYERGMLIAGTSAGAAMMSSVMIVGSAPTMTLRAGVVELGSGLGFLPGVLIDQHFEQRGRLRRLLAAIAQHPHELGLGLDEDTGVVVDGHAFEVFGSGSVTVVDAGAATDIRVPESGPIAVSGACIHVLPAGCRFELSGRRPSIVDVPAGERGRAA